MNDKPITLDQAKKEGDMFEMHLKELESIVYELEGNNNLSLSDMLEKYQRGAALLKDCKTSLGSVENFVSQSMLSNNK